MDYSLSMVGLLTRTEVIGDSRREGRAAKVRPLVLCGGGYHFMKGENKQAKTIPIETHEQIT